MTTPEPGSREVIPRPKSPKKARRTVSKSPALAKEKATQLHSKIVRSKGVCENCGYECPCEERWPEHFSQDRCKLQAAHIVSRTYSHTRTDERNALSLCSACHQHFTVWPIEFASFVNEKIGLVLYAELRAKAALTSKVNWAAEYERLARLWIAIGGNP